MAIEFPKFAHLAPGGEPAELVCGWVAQHLSLGHDMQQLTILAASARLSGYLRKNLSLQHRGFLPDVVVVDEELDQGDDADGLVDVFSWLMEILTRSAGDHPHIPQSVQARTKLADEILTVFDEWVSDDVAKPRLTDAHLLPGRLAQHALFLIDQYDHFRGMLEKGQMRYPSWSRHLALKARAEHISGPTLLVGSTGSMASMRQLMKAVLHHDQGFVLLPPRFGRDEDLQDSQHPDQVFAPLLQDLAPLTPKMLPTHKAGADGRADLIKAVFDTASQFGWGDPPNPDAFDGLSLTRLDNVSELPGLILTMLQEARSRGEELSIVSPDARMLRHAHDVLMDHQVPVDSGMAQPLMGHPSMAVRLTILGILAGDNISLRLAVLLRDGVRGGVFEKDLPEKADKLLRRPNMGWRPGQWIQALVKEVAQEFAEELSPGPLDELAQLFMTHLANPPRQLADAMAVVEQIAAHLGAEELPVWRDHVFPKITMNNWAEAHQHGMAQASRLRMPPPPAQANCEVRLMGSIAARASFSGLFLVLGLEEGSWPSVEASRGGLSTAIRKKLNLKQAEWRLALQAHDLANLLAKKNVHLVAVAEKAAQPQISSRYVQRLQAISELAGVTLRDLRPHALATQRAMEQRQKKDPRAKPARPPMPKPALERRPRSLSITELEHWVRDPYRIYVRRVLGLRELDAHGRAWDARDSGQLIHDGLEALAHQHDLDEVFRQADARLARMIRGQARRHVVRGHLGHILTEAEGAHLWQGDWRIEELEKNLEAVMEIEGHELRIYGRADRLDRQGGALRVLDYKTGMPPSKKQVATHMAPQLTATAWILAQSGEEVTELAYVQVPENRLKKPFLLEVGGGNMPELLADFEARIKKRILQFANPDLAYTARLSPKDDRLFGDLTEHLARTLEWVAEEE